VGQQAPGGGIPLGRKEIAPVLSDEPRPEDGRNFRPVRQAPEFGDPADEENCKHAEPERELMDADSTEVDARTKPVSFQAQHARRVDTNS